jgi:hypothetical protein
MYNLHITLTNWQSICLKTMESSNWSSIIDTP